MKNLAEMFMLVIFHQNQRHFSWVTDKASAQKTAKETGAKVEDVHSSKRRIAKEALKKINEAMDNAYNLYFSKTYATGEKGQRLLPIPLIGEFERSMKEMDDSVATARDKFLEDYPIWVDEARERLQGLFKEEDYPSVSEMADRFRISCKILPLPSLLQISPLPSAIEKIVTRYMEEENERKWNVMMIDIWDKLQAPIVHLVERLGKAENKFKNSIIGNIKEICETLSILNLNGETGVDEMRSKIEKLFANINPDDLRDNRKMRIQTLREAESILSEIETARRKISI